MDALSIIFCIVLVILLVLNFWKNRLGKFLIFLRIAVVATIGLYFIYSIIIASLDSVKKDGLSVQLINKTPENLDFYIFAVNKNPKKNIDHISHSGNIRPEHFRVEYLEFADANELWLIAYDQRKRLVYFSQNNVPNKNIDRKIVVERFFNQSKKRSAIADSEVKHYQNLNIKTSIWICLSVLLLFLNFILLFKNKK